MYNYDYKSGKKRIKEILQSNLIVIEKEIPSEYDFTFSNGYYHWVTSIFVDIRDSSTIFSKDNKEVVSKMIRSFTSEVIEILRFGDNLREIGIRGDCVYAIYKSPSKYDIYELCNRTYNINSFMKMLNKLFNQNGFANISVGIGIATAQELVVKAGRKDTGINSKVWIGDAVTKASNLSSLGNRNGNRSIVMSELTYSNMIDLLVNDNGVQAKSWFKSNFSWTYGTYYDADVIKLDFDNWIDSGMPD